MNQKANRGGLKRIRLEFQPLVVRRTLVHEFFFMSISTFEAARQTTYPMLEGRLVGESFELMVKAMAAVMTGPQGKLPHGHSIADCLEQGADYEIKGKRELHQMLKNHWPDWEFIERLIDEDINPPQARYGSAGSMPNMGKGKARKPISGGGFQNSGWWIAQADSIYSDLRDSVGLMIWANWPDDGSVSADGLPRRRIKISPALGPGASIQPCHPTLDASAFGLLLSAIIDGQSVGNPGVIPLGRQVGKHAEQDIWVRTRINLKTAVDVQVRYKADGAVEAVTSNFRWIGKPKEGVSLAIHEGYSMVMSNGDGRWVPA